MVRLERETGVRRSTVAKWKTSPRTPQAATVNAVARVLGIDLTEALRLAGVIPPEGPAAEEVKDEPSLPEALAQLAALQARVARLEGRDQNNDKTG
jgi:transcriptional regulator with XRE-family HTH domain